MRRHGGQPTGETPRGVAWGAGSVTLALAHLSRTAMTRCSLSYAPARTKHGQANVVEYLAAFQRPAGLQFPTMEDGSLSVGLRIRGNRLPWLKSGHRTAP